MEKVLKKENILKIKNKELHYSSKIKIYYNTETNSYTIIIKNTTANMQEDYSNFESIVVWIWSVDQEKKIILKYEKYKGVDDKNEDNWNIEWNMSDLLQPYYLDKKGSKRAEPARLHYMRFLYRVMRFREAYKNFSLDKSNEKEINAFEKIFKKNLSEGKLWITKPENEGGLKGYKEEDIDSFDNSKMEENFLEKWFVIKSEYKELPSEMLNEFGNNRLYDQLPCSMFVGEPSASTRIFNSGYFDLWGINNKKELCVFELKKLGNEKLGIVSELFFYANIMKDMKEASKNKFNRIRANHRGFKKFVDNENSEIINAYFLVPDLHSSLKDVSPDKIKKSEKSFIDILNMGCSTVKFGLINFNQEKVEEDEDYKRIIEKWLNLKRRKNHKLMF